MLSYFVYEGTGVEEGLRQNELQEGEGGGGGQVPAKGLQEKELP